MTLDGAYGTVAGDLHLGQFSNLYGGVTIAIPAGSTSFQTALWANTADGKPRKVRLRLEEEYLLSTSTNPNVGDVYSFREVASHNSWQDVLLVTAADPVKRKSTQQVDFIETSGVLGDIVVGAVLGSSGTWSSFGGEVAISLVPVVGAWPDIRDVGIKLFKYNQAGLNEVDQFELAISALGIIGELGGPLDYFVD